LAGARERIGFDTEGRGFLLTRRVPCRHDRHEVRNFLEVLRADGVEIADDHLEAWISEEELRFAEKFLAGNRSAGEGVVAIHPFSADPARAWHEDNFVALSNALQERHGVRILMLGGTRDRALADSMAGRILDARSR
jgi:heptosyltransferase-2